MKSFNINAIIILKNGNYIINLEDDYTHSKIISDINKKLKLFYDFYDYINTKISIINNTNYNDIYNKLEKEYINKIDNLNKELEIIKNSEDFLVNKRVNEIDKINKQELKIIKKEYKLEMNTKILKIKEQYEEEKKQLEIQNNQLQIKLEQYDNFTNQLNNLDNTINTYFGKNLSTIDKGNIGEGQIYSDLCNILDLSEYNINLVSGQSNCGDIFLKYKNILKCCIECKNHSKPISQNEINRFLETDTCHPQYNCGIFISLRSKFVGSSNINNFDIIYNKNNKPCIFLCNYTSIDILKYSIKILTFILNIQNINENNINYIEQFKSFITLLIELEDINNKNIKNIQKSLKIINNKKKELENLLNI